jgi:putative transposase
MKTLVRVLLQALRSCFRTRLRLQTENLPLRHQITVLQRGRKRLPLNAADRFLWACLSRLWAGWRSALAIFKPETVIRWHRTGFRLYWRWKSRGLRLGRPQVPLDVQDLIRKMSLANPLWGAPRIHGELLKLGIPVSHATVAK